jgi:hypothetical protein
VTNEAIRDLLSDERFRVNAIAGFSSRLVGIAQAAKNNILSLKGISLIIYAGEPLPEGQRALLRDVCDDQELQFLGLYGSAECGVFAFQTNQTLNKAMELMQEPTIASSSSSFTSQPDIRIYEYSDDICHAEILQDSNEEEEEDGKRTFPTRDNDPKCQGRLIVTNLIRRPHLIRFDTGDTASSLQLPKGNKSQEGRLFFRLHGRHHTSHEISLGRSWIYFSDVLKSCSLLPELDLNDCLVQVRVEGTSSGGGIGGLTPVTLLILPPKEVSSEISALILERFKRFIEGKTGDGVKPKLRIVKEEKEFVRSSRSQKLLKFVDFRVDKEEQKRI